MIAALLLALQTQAPPPTVGDTIWLERTIEVPAGAEVRAAAWDPEGDISLLGQPVVKRSGGSATIAYPAVAWTAGTHTVMVPGPILIGHDGATDSLPPESRTIQVATVLPVGQPPEKLSVQPEAGVVAERIHTPWPVLTSLLAAAVLLAPLVWWWRRRGPPMPVARPAPERSEVPLTEWTEAGEPRAVAAVAAHTLRAAIIARLPGSGPGLVTTRLMRVLEEQRPQWPAAEIGRVLRGLDAAQFGAAPADGVVDLATRAGELGRQLESAS
jgi:hypothetical protein